MRTRTLVPWLLAGIAACSPARTLGAAPQLQSIPAGSDDALRDQSLDQQIRQALARLTFGARPGDYERVRAMGVDRWIALQLEPSRIDDRVADSLVARLPTLGPSSAELVRAYPPPQLLLAARRRAMRREGVPADNAESRAGLQLDARDSAALMQARRNAQRVLSELQIAKVERAEFSERQLLEVMVDFWTNHFSVFANKGGPERYYLASFERDAIRPHALGKFRDLLEAVAKSPAMLFYLDNWESRAEPGHPTLADLQRRRPYRLAARAARPAAGTAAARAQGLNENYGRELLELHTLGVQGGYTQADVIAAARAFTGWTIDRPQLGGGFAFRPAMHDAGEKVFLGHTLPAGRGMEDGEAVLDIVARSSATARFIAGELARRFVSDTAPPELVERAARTYLRTDGDIRETLRTIVTSPEFFSRAAYKAKVKSPFELVVSALRAVDAAPDTTPRTARVIALLGEPLYLHRDPNGYPETGDAWVNTGAILSRINFGLALASGRLPGVSIAAWEHRSGLDTLSGDAQVDGVIRAVLDGEVSPDTRRILSNGVNPLLSDATPDSSGSIANDDDDSSSPAMAPSRDSSARGVSRRRDPLTRAVSLHSLEQIVGLAFGAPEFQRR